MKTVRTAAVILLALSGLILSSCVAMDADFTLPWTVYVDERVNRVSTPEVYVEPVNPPMEPLTAIIVPFRVTQDISDSNYISTELTRIFWNTWLGQKVFPGLMFAEGQIWLGPQQGLRQAAASGADLVIGGEITHVMFGGTSGDTTIAMRVEVYDGSTGQMIWSMAHAGRMTAGITKDFIFARQKARLNADPTHAIMSTLAADLAQPVAAWNYGGLMQGDEEMVEPSPLNDPAEKEADLKGTGSGV